MHFGAPGDGSVVEKENVGAHRFAGVGIGGPVVVAEAIEMVVES